MSMRGIITMSISVAIFLVGFAIRFFNGPNSKYEVVSGFIMFIGLFSIAFGIAATIKHDNKK